MVYCFGLVLLAVKIIDSFKVDDNGAIKMNALKYSKFFDKMFFECYSSQPSSFNLKSIFHAKKMLLHILPKLLIMLNK